MKEEGEFMTEKAMWRLKVGAMLLALKVEEGAWECKECSVEAGKASTWVVPNPSQISMALLALCSWLKETDFRILTSRTLRE